MDLDVIDLNNLILDLINKINKYINLEPKETTPLGSCIGTWNELLEKNETRAGGSALSSNPQGFGSTPSVGLAPSFVCLIALSFAVRLVSSSIRWGRSLVVGLCPLPLGSIFRRRALPLVVVTHRVGIPIHGSPLVFPPPKFLR
jgi:hypothetical protein